jgi:hypothetical protein
MSAHLSDGRKACVRHEGISVSPWRPQTGSAIWRQTGATPDRRSSIAEINNYFSTSPNTFFSIIVSYL